MLPEKITLFKVFTNLNENSEFECVQLAQSILAVNQGKSQDTRLISINISETIFISIPDKSILLNLISNPLLHFDPPSVNSR